MMDIESLKNNACIHLITGHYGSGKTNYALNLAISLKESGENVCILDMDVVNPYFRTSDFSEILQQNGIEMIKPNYAGTNLDVPSVSQFMHGAFSRTDAHIVADIGGDDAGATILGSMQKNIADRDYSMYYVVNRYRYMTRKEKQAVEILREVEQASGLQANIIVNNSNLGELTRWDTIEQSEKYGHEIGRRAGISTVIQTVPGFLNQGEKDKTENKQFIEIYSTKSWT